MTFSDAAKRAAAAVYNADPNISVEKFNDTIPSLVIMGPNGDFEAMTVTECRKHPEVDVAIVIMPSETFGG